MPAVIRARRGTRPCLLRTIHPRAARFLPRLRPRVACRGASAGRRRPGRGGEGASRLERCLLLRKSARVGFSHGGAPGARAGAEAVSSAQSGCFDPHRPGCGLGEAQVSPPRSARAREPSGCCPLTDTPPHRRGCLPRRRRCALAAARRRHGPQGGPAGCLRRRGGFRG